MKQTFRCQVSCVFMLCFFAARAAADEPLTLENVTSPGPNMPDEPVRQTFSMDAAVRFLDANALSWQKERKCFACHSNYIYLMVRPEISHEVRAHDQIRGRRSDAART